MFNLFWIPISKHYKIYYIMQFIVNIFQIPIPFYIKYLIEWNDDQEAPKWHGYFIAFLLSFSAYTLPLCIPYAENHQYEMSFRMYSNLLAYVFDKSWKMKTGASKWLNGGKISNLISSDVTQIANSGHSYVFLPVSDPLFSQVDD